MFEHGPRPLRAGGPRLPTEASLHVRSPGAPSTGQVSGLQTLTSPVADAASGRTLPAGLGVWSRHRASVPTAPWAWLHQHFLWMRVGSHVSALWLPHGPRHPAGDPERCLPHPCPQTCVHSCARLSFWKKVCGLGLNPGSSSRWLCTSH